MSLSFGVYLEITCFFTALFCLFKVKDNPWRCMILYLFIICLAEITGHFLKRAVHGNQWVYNLLLIADAVFVSNLFNHVLKQYTKATPLIISGLALVFSFYIFLFFKDGFWVYHDVAETVMSVVFVVYSFYYYFLLIKDEHHTDLSRSASFWWVTGSLFYYFGSTASNLFYGYLTNVSFAGRNISYTINIALCTLLYGCWIYSFICKRWQATRSAT